MNNRIQNRPLGWVPDDFSLKGTDGEVYSLQNILGNNGLVVMFICNHCPYVKAITKQLVEDVKTLKENDISSIAIMSNDFKTYPDDNYENMQKFSERNNFNFPYVMALCTPDFFGFDSELKLKYRGRLNDSGKNQTTSNAKRELVNAMLSISNKGISSESQFASIGCSIKWR